MRNKLTRSKKRKEAACRRKEQAQTAEVMRSVPSASSCSSDKTSTLDGSASLAARDKNGPDASAAGTSDTGAQPPQEQRGKVKIAPIFLRTPRRSECRGSGDGELGRPVETPQKPGPPPQSQRRVSTSAASRLTETEGFVPSARRGQLSPSSLHSCLEEIKTSNPAFPVETLFSTLRKKASEGVRDFGSSGEMEGQPVNSVAVRPLHSLKTHLSKTENSLCTSSPQKHLKEKRKRGDESSEPGAKRLRFGLNAEGAGGVDRRHLAPQGVRESIAAPVQKQPSGSKLSRTHRLRQQSVSQAGVVNSCEPDSGSDSPPPTSHDILHRDCRFEDILWTDKYSPQHSSEVIGNSVSMNKLHGWLKQWKIRTDCDWRKTEERKDEDNSNDLWDCGDFQGEAGAEDNREDPLCNTILITGPTGVGKTASVYACAQELGFKVFEVNSSSQRSGRQVLSQLKEATQSHLVETSGKDPLKPAYFSNYNTSSCTPKAEALPGKTVPLKNVISTSKKRAAKKFGRSTRKGKAYPATVTLASYFKMKAKADHLHFCGQLPYEKADSKILDNSSPGCDHTVPQSKKKTTSLILFEEVDVIFDDDVGFLTAIKTFMTTTKRPVILTTNDPLFRERFNGNLEEIIFKTPPAVNVCSYLQLVCLAENVRLELDDVRSLLILTGGDVRRCLMQLQLWVDSSGRQACQNGVLPKDPTYIQYSYAAEDNLDRSFPPCDTGCTASMLGLPTLNQNQLLNLLNCQHWSEKDLNKLLRLLAESWRGGVPLLYTNLDLLLSIFAKVPSFNNLDKVTSGLQSEQAPTDTDPHFEQLSQNFSPKVSVSSSKCVRNISRLSRRKYFATVLNTTSSSTWTHKPQRTSLSLKGTHIRLPGSRDKAEQISTDCLDALADFFDLMSYLDVTLPAISPLVSGSCRPEVFVWTGAEIKDSLLDERSEEEECGSWSQERLLDIQAASEGLGCHRCLWRVREAWAEAQKYKQEVEDKKWKTLVDRLTFLASSNAKSLRFYFQRPCEPSVSQRRYKLNRTVLSSKSFSLLGNRQAVIVDYMPVLRSICHFHRAQQQKEEPVRCLNYLSNIDLGLSKSTIQLLTEDFSEKNLERPPHLPPVSIHFTE